MSPAESIDAALERAQAMIDALGVSTQNYARVASNIQDELFKLEVVGVSRNRNLSVTTDFQGVPKSIQVADPNIGGTSALKAAVLDAQQDAHRQLAVRLNQIIEANQDSEVAKQMIEPILELIETNEQGK